MEIEIPQGKFELDNGTTIDFTETNPFVEDTGSQSVPLKLPASERNLRLLGHPQRLTRRAKYHNRYPATVTEGVYRRNGDMVVFEASEQGGITGTFYLASGELYSRMQKVLLTELGYGPPRTFPKETLEEKVYAWLDHFLKVMQGTEQDEFAVFPVATELENFPDNQGRDMGVYQLDLLNQPNPDKPSGTGLLWDFMARDPQTDKDGNSLPVGYGVTPFLYAADLLRYIFRHFGYELNGDGFDTRPTLRRLVVLNCTADAIVGGTLSYKQLVPDVTVGEFLDCFRKKFDMDFVVDSATRTVSVCFFPDTVSGSPADDYSPYLNGSPVKKYTGYKQVVLKAGKSIEWADTDADTLEEMVAKYRFIMTVDEAFFTNPPDLSSQTIIFRKATGTYYKVVNREDLTFYIRLGSCMFDYDKKGTLEGQSYESKDEQVSLVSYHPSSSTRPLGGSPSYSGVLAPIVGSRRHLNSRIKKANGEQPIEKEKKNPIMFCFAAGVSSGMYSWKYYMGTPLEYNDAGIPWGNLSLSYAGENGLFQLFWKKRDAILRHSYQPVSAELVLPLKKILSLKMTDLTVLNGEPLLKAKLDYTIGEGVLEVKGAEFRTIRLQEPYNLEEEQSVPNYTPQKYYWVVSTDIAVKIPEYRQKYSNANGMGEFVQYDTESYPASPATLEPPTEEQAGTGGRFFEASYYLRIQVRKQANPGWTYSWVTEPYRGWYIVMEY